MANIRPFVALRPNKNQVEQVAALPYDVFSRSEAAEYVDQKHNSIPVMICMPMMFIKKLLRC